MCSSSAARCCSASLRRSLFLAANATVTMAHSRTRDLKAHARRADILVAAIGKPNFVPGDWIKPGAIVIDVGINRVDIGGGKTKVVGDVDYDAAEKVAGFITPVPGRRRRDDHRLPDAQHADRRRAAIGRCRAGHLDCFAFAVRRRRKVLKLLKARTFECQFHGHGLCGALVLRQAQDEVFLGFLTLSLSKHEGRTLRSVSSSAAASLSGRPTCRPNSRRTCRPVPSDRSRWNDPWRSCRSPAAAS